MKKITIFAAIAALLGSSLSASAAAPTTVNHPDWSRDAVIYEVNWRQITPDGTITSLTRELPRLNDLGVDILWLMPIHPISELNRKGGLGSYYSVKDYKAVNPELGTFDQFKAFVDEAHSLGMKVIIDWVPNHSGCDNQWVTDHPDWYALDENGKMFGPYDWTDVYQFNYANPEMRAAMVDALKFWLTEAGIDGFRCDVAMLVPTDFWDETRPQLQAVKPDLFMLAEASEPDLVANAFDMAYNWPMKDVFNAIANSAGERTYPGGENLPAATPAAIDELLARQASQFAEDSYLMNMVTNHDLNSWEGTEFERLGNLTNAFAVLSYTLPGMPLIYTGQETGMNRAFEFFVKDVPPTFEPRNEYFTFYRKLNDLKHNEKALRAGTEGAPIVRYPTTDTSLYAFSRSLDGSNVFVIANLGAEEAPVAFDGKAPDLTIFNTDYFAGTPAALPATLAPGAYVVLTSK